VKNLFSPRRHGDTENSLEELLGRLSSLRQFESIPFVPALPFSVTPCLRGEPGLYNFKFRNRSELLITETELKLMAAAAKTGFNVMWKTG
jgi:hypothetical protein